jgi:23S rRNA (cytosine1962-C5)-methyltransferase
MDRAIVTARGAARWVSRQHPWIYRSDIAEFPSSNAGAVEVSDERGSFIGVALWSPRSTISLRMLTREQRVIDEAFWRERLEASSRYRGGLALDAAAYRLAHAEADGLPSLIVDRYDQVLVIQLLSAGLETFRESIMSALCEVFRPAGILARNDVPVREHEGLPRQSELLYGVVPDLIEVFERGVRYLAAPWSGQKTGAFLDQRENRARAGELAHGMALDCFTYHGLFALHLARSRSAREVVAVDSSNEALERARANADLNGAQNVRFECANVFDFLRAEEAARRRYDVVVLDPPAFAKRRDAIDQALRGYKEINLRAMRLLHPGGILCTFSCSYHVDRSAFRTMLASAASDAGRPMRLIEDRKQSLDHPEVLQIPETSYLKGAILQVV